MKINQFTDYSLRVLLFLGLKKEKATVSEIAKAFRVSPHHLVKVVHRLAQEGYVRSYKGKGGGIELAKDPDLIQIGEFIREREPMDFVECFQRETNTCPIQGVCGLESALYRARQAFLDVLNSVTLADFLKPGKSREERMKRLGLSTQ